MSAAWTDAEVAMLEQHLRRKPATPWSDLATLMPGRSVPALKAKWHALYPELKLARGRPRTRHIEPQADSPREAGFDKMVARGTIRLGRAIDALCERSGWSMAA